MTSSAAYLVDYDMVSVRTRVSSYSRVFLIDDKLVKMTCFDEMAAKISAHNKKNVKIQSVSGF